MTRNNEEDLNIKINVNLISIIKRKLKYFTNLYKVYIT